MYWRIKPYHSRDADYCILPAGSDEDDRAALEYAQARIEALWVEAKVGTVYTVTIQLCGGPIPPIDVEGEV